MSRLIHASVRRSSIVLLVSGDITIDSAASGLLFEVLLLSECVYHVLHAYCRGRQGSSEADANSAELS